MAVTRISSSSLTKFQKSEGLTAFDSGIEYLVVGGGGPGGGTASHLGGGSGAGGGGGAGGYRTNRVGDLSGAGSPAEGPQSTISYPFSRQRTISNSTISNLSIKRGEVVSFRVTVGGGGRSNGYWSDGSSPGSSSVFGNIEAVGGGKGGKEIWGGDGSGELGGSGGGQAYSTSFNPGPATPNQGKPGQDKVSNSNGYRNGTGGGGSASNISGLSGNSSQPGQGGLALTSNINGSSQVYAAGGAGGGGYGNGTPNTSSPASGIGGTGSLQSAYNSQNPPVINTGSGGGGGGYRSNGGGGYGGSTGASGVVIIRYPAEYTLIKGASHVITTTTIGSEKVTKFTAGDDIASLAIV